LIGKWQKALDGVEETRKAYDGLTNRLDSDWITDWTALEERALVEGGESLKIYQVSLEKGGASVHFPTKC